MENRLVGDSNGDGVFDSGDLISVLRVGEYEDGIAGNSDWEDGDWNADADFDSSDFVAAFTAGGYELGPKQAVSAVPEPSALSAILLSAGLLLSVFRRSR